MNTLSPKLARHVVDLFKDKGVEWLERLPQIVADCEQKWSLRALAPLEDLSYNYIAPAVRTDGTEVILKIGVPNPELTSEMEALLLYDGRGCVRLLEVDRDRGALLLERLQPGTALSSIVDDEEATRIAARVMAQLWREVPPEHPFPTVARWAAGLARMRHHFAGGTGPLPKDLVERAEDLFAELLDSMDESVLLHGDLHHGNILRAERQPWLAIDPKGVVGEAAYEVGAILRNIAPRLLQQPRPSQVLARRVEIFAAELGFDPVRLLGWGLAQAVLAAWWCIEDHGRGGEWFIHSAQLMREVMG